LEVVWNSRHGDAVGDRHGWRGLLPGKQLTNTRMQGFGDCCKLEGADVPITAFDATDRCSIASKRLC
jgi:hypothetical protein